MKDKLLLDQKSKVYIMAPANTATGGPELLHQLCSSLRSRNIDACMYYYPHDVNNPIHPSYEMYQNPYVHNIVDNEDNVIIVPELYSYIESLKNFKSIKRVIWWLSVDNYYTSKFLYIHRIFVLFMRTINKFLKVMGSKKKFPLVIEYCIEKYRKDSMINGNAISLADYHLVQSCYAKEHLKQHGILQATELSDYLNKNFLDISTNIALKSNKVAYNPAKGHTFTCKIIQEHPDIEFVPIEQMSKDEVITLLKQCKVYIDFGHHPGKDRIPREAALLGCCVLTNRRGSANFFTDVPILDSYKYNETQDDIRRLGDMIRDIFVNFETHYDCFKMYRNRIKDEPAVFEMQIENFFTQSEKK